MLRRRRCLRGMRVKKRRRAASDKQYGTGFAPQRVQNLFRMETTTETRNSSQRVSIGLLNDAVGKEIASSLQYIYFHVHFEDARYRYLSELMHRVAIAEMRHIELFAERILFLGGGDVEMNPSLRTRPLVEPLEMLRLAMQLEQNTVASYNEAARIACEQKDAATRALFERAVAEEERHLDAFRAELQHLLDYGEHYLALQSVAASRREAEQMGHPVAVEQ